jgi:YD repeat-containing protein
MIKKLTTILFTLAVLIATTTYAGIEPTSGRYIESKTDLSIKVIGGQLKWTRNYRDRQWRFNRAWESLIIKYDAATGTVDSIQRANDPYKKLDSAGTIFKYGKRSTIRKQSDGTWLWKDRDGNSASYDANGKTLRMDSKGGAFITLMYNGDSKLSGAKDVHGTQILWIEYDAVSGKVSKAKDYGNREVLYTWQVVNATASPKRYKLVNVKDARGYDWQYAYSASEARDGRVDVISRTDPEGRVVAVAYGGSGRATGVTNALGHKTSYQFDYIKARKEFYLKTTYPGGRVTETWYERDGEVKRRDINGINIITITEDLRKDIEKDTFGRTTTKEYDEFKNLLKTTYPDGTSTSTTYNVSNSNMLTKTDERGTITKYDYWANGKVKKITEALGTSVERSTEYTYDAYGQMLTKIQVGDAVTETAITQYFYDNKGNVNKIIDAELNERQYTSYDSQGNNLIMIDGRGNPWTYGYDAHGNQISDKNPLNEETTNEYNKVDRLVKTTYPDSNFIQFEYDNKDRLIKSIDELGYFDTTTYDQAGNRIKEIDKVGRITQYRYDLLNRQDEIEDAAGNIIKYTYPNVNSSNLNFGSIYQPMSIQFPTYQQSFKYDLRKRVFGETLNYQTSSNIIKSETKKIKYDARGNRIESIDAENRSTKDEYDSLNRVTKSIDPLLQETSFMYDKRNNLLSVTDALNQTHTFTYDKNNQEFTESRPLGQTENYIYNGNYLIETKTDAKGQKTVYMYDSANRNTQIKYYKTDNSLDKTITFTYNNRGILISYDDGTTQGLYTYDNAQQKLTEAITYGVETFALSYSYHPDGRKSSYIGIDNITYNYFVSAN